MLFRWLGSRSLPVPSTRFSQPSRLRFQLSTHENRNTMSSSHLAQPRQYLILISDHPGTAALRRAAQPEHIESASPLIESGHLSYFGVTFSQPRTSSSEPEINGSLMILHANSEQEVRRFLLNDPYTKRGVWNVASAQIRPFKAG